MHATGTDLSERLLDYVAHIIWLVESLPNNFIGRRIGDQLLRSGTSVGANYEEAQGAESKKDFIHKLQVVLKELRESLFWMRVSLKADLVSMKAVCSLLREGNELANIIGKSAVTSKKGTSKGRPR